MKKVAIILLTVMALGLIVSCATNHEVALSQNKGVVGKNGIKRPDWVIYDQSNAVNHYVAGYGTGKTFEVAKQKAQLNADADLALWVADSVKAVRDRYIEESFVGDNETYIDKFVSTATEKGSAILSGRRIYKRRYRKTHTRGEGKYKVWVLRSIPVANVKAQIDAAIATTCADETLFASGTDANEVMAKLEKILDEYFPEQ